MKRKGAIMRARETVVAAGKGAAERTKVLAGEVADAAATAGATASAASMAAASVVLDRVATAIQASALKGANAVARVGWSVATFFDHRPPPGDVRFTPKSGHVRCNQRCPLWANSGHSGAV